MENVDRMKRLQFWKLDAFTDGSSPGNPAAMVLLDDTCALSVSEMQKVAAELGGFVSEVAFVKTAGQNVELRYFSRECEVAFCGHATLAVCHHLLSSCASHRGLSSLLLSTPKGQLNVVNRLSEDGCVYVEAPALSVLPSHATAADAAVALGILPTMVDLSVIDSEQPLPFVECGLRSLLVPAVGLEVVLGCRPDYETLRAFLQSMGAETLVLFSRETASPACDVRTRVFPPPFGYLEDPATGTGNAALAGWLQLRALWAGPVLAVEQGPDRTCPNLVKLRADASGKLEIGGKAVVRIEGTYCLH
jgi:PhzF family phenazine biosynthesis protein